MKCTSIFVKISKSQQTSSRDRREKSLRRKKSAPRTIYLAYHFPLHPFTTSVETRKGSFHWAAAWVFAYNFWLVIQHLLPKFFPYHAPFECTLVVWKVVTPTTRRTTPRACLELSALPQLKRLSFFPPTSYRQPPTTRGESFLFWRIGFWWGQCMRGGRIRGLDE